jgi:hypothetical protein
VRPFSRRSLPPGGTISPIGQVRTIRSTHTKVQIARYGAVRIDPRETSACSRWVFLVRGTNRLAASRLYATERTEVACPAMLRQPGKAVAVSGINPIDATKTA